jgi:protein-L-isoaspartate(D-aspartate) O-methyltransferase
MSGMRRVGAIDISEDMRHERREWIVQRVGWAAMAGFLAAAALGLFGSGPLARAVAGGPALRVDYPVFTRREAPAELRVEAVSAGPDLRIAVSRDFLTDNELESMTPEPDATLLEGDRLVHVFRAGPGTHRVVFEVRAHHLGRQTAEVSAGGDTVPISQLVFP